MQGARKTSGNLQLVFLLPVSIKSLQMKFQHTLPSILNRISYFNPTINYLIADFFLSKNISVVECVAPHSMRGRRMRYYLDPYCHACEKISIPIVSLDHWADISIVSKKFDIIRGSQKHNCERDHDVTDKHFSTRTTSIYF